MKSGTGDMSMLRASDSRRGHLQLTGIMILFLCAACANFPFADSGSPSHYAVKTVPIADSHNTAQTGRATDQAYIKYIQTIGITSSGATVVWTTDYPSSGIVQWGKTTDYEFTLPVNVEPGGQPTVRLTGLTPNTRYYYAITLNSKNGTPITSPAQTFETLEPLYTRPLLILGISISEITVNSATITWTTGVPSISQVEYDTGLPYGNITPPDGSPLYAHTVTLTNLIGNSFYHFRIRATDLAGNVCTSEDTVFVTPAIQHMLSTMNQQGAFCGCKGHRYSR